MKKVLLAVGLMMMAGGAMAAKNCDELKYEITEKINSKGVKNYTLDVVDRSEAEKDTSGRIIGTCNAGRQAIVYRRN